MLNTFLLYLEERAESSDPLLRRRPRLTGSSGPGPARKETKMRQTLRQTPVAQAARAAGWDGINHLEWERARAQWNGVSSQLSSAWLAQGASLLLSTEVSRPGSQGNYAGKQLTKFYGNWYRFLCRILDLFRKIIQKLLDNEFRMATYKNNPITQHVSRLNEIFIRDEDKESNALILPGHGSKSQASKQVFPSFCHKTSSSKRRCFLSRKTFTLIVFYSKQALSDQWIAASRVHGRHNIDIL